jgi:hypothetical protein
MAPSSGPGGGPVSGGPATGTARPVSASASVPMTSRSAPVDPEEVPPPVAAPQARVYGRPASAPQDDEPAEVPDNGAWPWDARRAKEQQAEPGPDHSMYQRGPEPPASAPQSPGRTAGRASASARVTPPAGPPAPEAPTSGPYSEFTTDVAGRSGRPEPQTYGTPPQHGPVPPDHYGEHTSDISGRGQQDQPYVPPSALPAMHAAPPLENGFPPPNQPPPPPGVEGDRPRMGGVFPGPASRPTVAPPPPDETASWPGSPEHGADGDQGRFDQFKPEMEAAPPAKPETHVRMLPILIGVIIVAGLIVGLALGLVYLISGNSDNDANSGLAVKVGECLKRDGERAENASCTDAGAYEVVSITDAKEKCADPGQPIVVNPTEDGRTQVLCLKPRG